MFTYISEESFFIGLTWFHPALSGIIVSMLLGEKFLDSNTLYTSLFWYSSCSKTAILWEEFNTSIAYNIFSVSSIAIVSITIIAHILLLVRLRQLRKKRAQGRIVVIYDSDGVLISKRNEDLTSCRTLWRHERSVVTPKASLFSFIYRLVNILHQGTLYHITGPSGLAPWAQVLIFTIFSQVFFLFNLIETVFSPTLRNSLIDFFPSSRYIYNTVNV